MKPSVPGLFLCGKFCNYLFYFFVIDLFRFLFLLESVWVICTFLGTCPFHLNYNDLLTNDCWCYVLIIIFIFLRLEVMSPLSILILIHWILFKNFFGLSSKRFVSFVFKETFWFHWFSLFFSSLFYLFILVYYFLSSPWKQV